MLERRRAGSAIVQPYSGEETESFDCATLGIRRRAEREKVRREGCAVATK